MKINNRNKINSTRDAINHLITVLESRIRFEDEDTGSIKSAIKTKKNAFMRSKYLLGKLQRMETDQSKESEIGWYSDIIKKLVSAAEVAMGDLVKAMREDINTEDKSTAVNSAIDSKQEAYDHMDDLHKGVSELENILKGIEAGEGVGLISENDFKASFAEEHAYEGFYKKINGKYKSGYNKELDAIVISYDGTIGDIIECYGLRIALPRAPKINTFKNRRHKAHKQYWIRPEQPKGLSKDNATPYLEYIEEEFRRRDEGYWFLNNGELEYLTGVHYMLLTHLKTDADGGYFHFRKAHRNLLYFLEACWVDERSMGAILGKTRRTGATFVAAAFAVTKGGSIREALFGLTSKKDSDARKVFEKITNMFKNLPFYFKPINTGETLTKELVFRMPSSRTTKNSKEVVYDELNSVLNFEATTEDSYDSQALRFYIADEFSKWLRGSISTNWSKVRKTLTKGSRITGKAFVLSTVEYFTGADPDDEDAQNGDRFKKLFYDSDPNDRLETGLTKSGLYKIFISSLDNYEGHIDRYGNCIRTTPDEPIEGVDGEPITMGVQEYLRELWKPHANNPSKLNDEKRKDPITEEDMFRVASDQSLFDVLKIQDQIEHNNNYYIANDEHQYKIGNFIYTDANRNRVKFVEAKNGRFKISWLPDPSMANQYSYNGGNMVPAYDNLGTFGIDPYKLSKTVDGRGSKGGIVGYLTNHPMDDIPKDQFFLVYLARPQTIDVFMQDVAMCLLYYGMPALIENNVPELLKYLYDLGMTKYSMRRPDKVKLSYDEMKYGGIPSNDTKLIMAQAMALEKHIEDHIGVATTEDYRELGEIGNCPFNELLNDWLSFDVSNRTKYDATVASCLSIYGSQKAYVRNVRSNTKRMKVTDFYNLQTA